MIVFFVAFLRKGSIFLQLAKKGQSALVRFSFSSYLLIWVLIGFAIVSLNLVFSLKRLTFHLDYEKEKKETIILSLVWII